MLQNRILRQFTSVKACKRTEDMCSDLSQPIVLRILTCIAQKNPKGQIPPPNHRRPRNFDFKPANEIFSKNVNYPFFKNGDFGGYDLENWVWTKLALWICPILWISFKIVYTQLSLTFFYYYRPIRPIYQQIKKIIFLKKMLIFESKICCRRAKTGSIGTPR